MATERGSWATMSRLIAALVHEDLVASDRLQVTLAPGADPRSPHPGQVLPPVRLDGAEVHRPHELFDGLDLPGKASARRQVARLLSSAAQFRSLQRPPLPALEGTLGAWDRYVVDGDSWDPCDQARPGVRVGDAATWARPEVMIYSVPAAGIGALGGLPVHEAATDQLLEAVPSALPLRTLTAEAAGVPGEVVVDGVRLVLTLPGSDVPAADAVTLGRWVLAATADGMFPIRDVEAVEVSGVGALVREDPQERLPGERLISCAALLEPGANGRPLLLELPGADRPERFLGAWAGRLLDGAIGLLDRGLAVPASGWGLVARYRSGRLKGFAVRDLGRTRVHLPTVATWKPGASLPEGSAAPVSSALELAAVLHEHVVLRHLADVVHALGLGERGWRIVRDKVDLLLGGSEAHQVWTALMVPRTCVLRSRLEGRVVTRDVPNPIA